MIQIGDHYINDDTCFGPIAQALAAAVESTERMIVHYKRDDRKRREEESRRDDAFRQLIHLGKAASVLAVEECKEKVHRNSDLPHLKSV